MDYIKLGRTGMDISRICVGGMSFGEVQPNFHKWVLNEEDTRGVVKSALDRGINFFDTANCYSQGTSEEFLGRAIRDYADRDKVVVATKVFIRMHEGPNGAGLSRKAIMSEIDKSLKRLGMDYVDLYIIHRWDYHTPIEETMEALHDVVKAGKARYLGASAMHTWQFQKAQYTADKHGWTRFVSMQNHYNLIYREEEREMMPLLIDQGVASTPYSPLAAGRLCRENTQQTKRFETDTTAISKYDGTSEVDGKVIERVAELAKRYGVSMTQISLAWLLHKQPVAAPIVGTTKMSHLDDAVAALDVNLTSEDLAYLEEPYVPHAVVGAI
ncbi:aldo/keto reductase [Eubacteriales bacterium OttesenSCG-928-N13]|nr:aldo/keto reductase [Eubacteriales bacterium OttesenSCG-928-N13]